MSYPALVTNALRALSTDTDTNNVGGRVEETLGKADELLVAHLLNKVIDGHGVDKLAIANGGAIGKVNLLLLGIDLGDLTALAETLLLLGDGVGNGDPNTTSAVPGGEAEGGVGTPVSGGLVQDNVLDDGLSIGGGDTLTEPLALHLSSCVSM